MKKEMIFKVIQGILFLYFLWYSLSKLENPENSNILFSIIYFISTLTLIFFQFYFYKKINFIWTSIILILWVILFWYYFLGFFKSSLLGTLDKISLFLFNLSLLVYLFYNFFKKHPAR
jgi:hypothetical protein